MVRDPADARDDDEHEQLFSIPRRLVPQAQEQREHRHREERYQNQIGPGISASCRAKKTPQGQAKIRTPPERGRALIPNIARVALHAIIVLRPDDRFFRYFLVYFGADGEAESEEERIDTGEAQSDGAGDDVAGHELEAAAEHDETL